MKRITQLKLCTVTCCCAGLLSCSVDSYRPQALPPGDTQPSFVLKYTIPDTKADSGIATAGSGIATRAPLAPVPPANEAESQVSNLQVLFFERDDFGNGQYVATCTAVKRSGTIQKTDSVEVQMGSLSPEQDYNVLVLANAKDAYAIYPSTTEFLSATALDKFCTGKTENRVKLQLQARMPEVSGKPGTYAIPTDGLMMSGTAVKQAGKNLFVSLVRAAVRIDVRVADEKQGKIILTAATLRNASPRIPLFGDPTDTFFTPLALQDMVTATDDHIKGGIYLTEVLRTGLSSDPALRSSQSACLLVSCHNTGYTGNRTWYRVEIHLEDDGTQYLKRNNAYTVVISNIKSLGAETPDEAYLSDATLIKSVTIPTEWKTPDVAPPVVDVN